MFPYKGFVVCLSGVPLRVLIRAAIRLKGPMLGFVVFRITIATTFRIFMVLPASDIARF